MTQRMMWVTWEDGAELSKSQKSPGDYSPLTRDADKQLGQVVLSDIDDDGVPGAGLTSLDSYAEEESASSRANREASFSDVVAEAMAEVAAEVMRELLEAAVEAAKPHVARWWNDQARPAISSAAQATRNKLRRTKSRRSAGDDVVPAEEAVSTDNSPQLEVDDESAAVMTMVEAEQRLTAALVARAFSDEQVRTVLNGRIVDEQQQEMRLSLKEVPRDEIELQVRQLLEANPTMLESLIELFADTQTRSEPALIEGP